MYVEKNTTQYTLFPIVLLCFSVLALLCGTYFFTEPRMSPVFYDMKIHSFSRSVDIKQRQEAEIC